MLLAAKPYLAVVPWWFCGGKKEIWPEEAMEIEVYCGIILKLSETRILP
jgi:hypothetical protein